MVELIPAPGTDYKTHAEVEAAWRANEPFYVNDGFCKALGIDPKPYPKTWWPKGCKVRILYRGQTREHVARS